MIYRLKNEHLTLAADSHGGELRSLIRNADGKELMWQADPAYWGRTSPVLFPFVGGTKDKTYYYNGVKYEARQHGFARDMEFDLLSQTDDELWFTLRDTEETRKNYPFSFLLSLGYRLEGNTAFILWKVENTGSEEMHFSIGGHPAFNCDLKTDALLFEKNGAPVEKKLISSVLDLTCNCLSDRKKRYPLTDGVLKLRPSLFDEDALIPENSQADAVTLLDKDGAPVLTVKFDAPVFGVWSPIGKNAPFVCIEPWYGRCDAADFSQRLEEKAWSRHLAPGETFSAAYTVTAANEIES